MNATTNTTTILERISAILGMVMMLAWTLGLGVVGFVILLGLFYAMAVRSETLAVLAFSFLFTPLLMISVWGFFSWTERLTKKWSVQDTVDASLLAKAISQATEADL